jgi:hypothetical protein
MIAAALSIAALGVLLIALGALAASFRIDVSNEEIAHRAGMLRGFADRLVGIGLALAGLGLLLR